MRPTLAALCLLVAIAAPAAADQTFTVTLTDDEAATVQDQVKLLNEFRRARPGPGVKAAPLPEQTPAGLVTEAVRAAVAAWEQRQTEDAGQRKHGDRTPRQRALVCKKAGLETCPGK